MNKRVIYQHDENDCGATCMSMVARYYGLKLPIARWRELTNSDRDGVSVYGIIQGAEKVGFHAECLEGTIDELLIEIKKGQIVCPFICHIVNEKKQGHFVVVSKYKKGKLYLLDPDKGKRQVMLDEFSKMWTGRVVTFEKTDDFVSGNYTKGTFKRYFYLLKGQYHKLTFAFTLSLIVAFIGIMSAFIFQTIVDEFGVTAGYYKVDNTIDECMDDDCDEEEHVGEKWEKDNLLVDVLDYIDYHAYNYKVFFIGAIFLYIIQYAIQYVRSWIMLSVSRKIDIQLSMRYFSDVLHLPMRAAEHRKTGEYLSRFSDAALVKEAVSNVTVTVMLDALMTVGCGIVLFVENYHMFLIALVVMMSYFIIVYFFRRPLEKVNRKSMQKNAEMESFIKEAFDGIETIKTCNSEDTVSDKSIKKFNALTKIEMKAGLMAEAQDVLAELVEAVGQIVIIWIGFALVLNGQITFGSLLSFFILLGYFTSPVKSLIQLQPVMQSAIIAAERLNDIIDIEQEDYSEKKRIPRNWESITCEDVVFQYGDRDPILNGIRLSIKRGQHVAIVGESGSGKTSLAKLMVSLYNPDKGNIFLDKNDYQEYSLCDFRRQYVYLQQAPYFFADTIKNNLLMGSAMSEDDMIDVCKKCCLDELFQKLPFGYDTMLSEMAKNLSSGQKQRLALARALLRNPSLLILDEATSNLDLITEAQIMEMLFENSSLTIVMIAHRLESIKECDNIIVMDNGAIAESGTHTELLQKKGIYYNMWEKQCQ